MRIPLAALALVLAAGLGVAAASAWSSDRAIFTADAAREKWGWLYRSGATAWTPALADVLGLEQRLPDYIRGEFTGQKGQSSSKSPLWERAKTYKRQYAGVRKQKRRFIHANFFCHDVGRNWLTEPVVVKDGGDCFFTVEYDVDNRSFAMLIINGEA